MDNSISNIKWLADSLLVLPGLPFTFKIKYLNRQWEKFTPTKYREQLGNLSHFRGFTS